MKGIIKTTEPLMIPLLIIALLLTSGAVWLDVDRTPKPQGPVVNPVNDVLPVTLRPGCDSQVRKAFIPLTPKPVIVESDWCDAMIPHPSATQSNSPLPCEDIPFCAHGTHPTGACCNPLATADVAVYTVDVLVGGERLHLNGASTVNLFRELGLCDELPANAQGGGC